MIALNYEHRCLEDSLKMTEVAYVMSCHDMNSVLHIFMPTDVRFTFEISGRKTTEWMLKWVKAVKFDFSKVILHRSGQASILVLFLAAYGAACPGFSWNIACAVQKKITNMSPPINPITVLRVRKLESNWLQELEFDRETRSGDPPNFSCSH